MTSETIHPRYVTFSNAKRSLILTHLLRIISILNKKLHGILVLLYTPTTKQIKVVNANKTVNFINMFNCSTQEQFFLLLFFADVTQLLKINTIRTLWHDIGNFEGRRVWHVFDTLI